MSYLVTENIGGNLHQAAAGINQLGVARFVLAMDFSGNNTVVVFRTDDYPSYVWLCGKLGRDPISTSEYFK